MNRSRIPALLVAAALAAALVRAEDSGPKPIPLLATFIGNMAFAITDGTTTIYTDFPYESGYSGYMTYDFSAVPKAKGALCLVTHGHRDHFDTLLFSKMDAMLIAPADVEARVPKERRIPFAPRMRYRDIEIEAQSTPHGPVGHASYLVTWHGLRLYCSGDTDRADQLLALKNLDFAFVSPWLIQRVAETRRRIDARQVVCYHHQADETVPLFQNRIVPRQGETLALPAVTATTAPR